MSGTEKSDEKSSSRERRFRLPGIEREGSAQLSLLETALWPLAGGSRPDHSFTTQYSYATPLGMKPATVTVRAPLGMQTLDEYVLWGLLGATLNRFDGEPVLLATPYWILRYLGLETGGTQYQQLRDAFTRLGIASYHNTAFYNPKSKEREQVLFQFLSYLLPTVNGVGESVDNDRCWRIEWNPVFFRFCKETGGNLLFDLDLYHELSPSARRLFLKLQDRFWRSKKVFLNVEELTVQGLGFAAERPLRKRKHDLLKCAGELLDHGIIALGSGQKQIDDIILKRGVGSYVAVFHEGDYFRKPRSVRTAAREKAIAEDPLFEPLRKLGVDEPAVRRLLKEFSRGLIQRWLRITDAAVHESPRGFEGFRISPAAFLIDGVQHRRTPPDWYYAHEKRMAENQWKNARVTPSSELTSRYAAERAQALQAFLVSEEGMRHYRESYPVLLTVAQVQEPHRASQAADEAARQRIEKLYFQFPDFETWSAAHQASDSLLIHA